MIRTIMDDLEDKLVVASVSKWDRLRRDNHSSVFFIRRSALWLGKEIGLHIVVQTTKLCNWLLSWKNLCLFTMSQWIGRLIILSINTNKHEKKAIEGILTLLLSFIHSYDFHASPSIKSFWKSTLVLIKETCFVSNEYRHV